jgi:hypothetical protein
MMPDESSTERSVNSGVICGAVARTIRKAKNAISARLTTPIAIIRVGLMVLKNETKACTGFL